MSVLARRCPPAFPGGAPASSSAGRRLSNVPQRSAVIGVFVWRQLEESCR